MPAAGDHGQSRHVEDGPDARHPTDEDGDTNTATVQDVDNMAAHLKKRVRLKQGEMHIRCGIPMPVVIFVSLILTVASILSVYSLWSLLVLIAAGVGWGMACGCCGCNDQHPSQCDCVCVEPPPDPEEARAPNEVIVTHNYHHHGVPAAQNTFDERLPASHGVHDTTHGERGGPVTTTAETRYRAFTEQYV
jgi:hypothetical protein